MKPSTEATSGDLPSYKIPQKNGPDLVQYEFPFVSDLPDPDQSPDPKSVEEESDHPMVVYFTERKHDLIHCEGAHLSPKRNFPDYLQTDFERDVLKVSAWLDKVGQLIELDNRYYAGTSFTVSLGLTEFLLQCQAEGIVSIESLVSELSCWEVDSPAREILTAILSQKKSTSKKKHNPV